MDIFIYCCLFLGILLSPGITLSRLFPKINFGLTAYISYSYCIFVAVIASKALFNFSWQITHYVIFSVLLISIFGFFLSIFHTPLQTKHNSKTLIIYSILISSIFLYHVIFGHYSEIPADLFTHIKDFKLSLIRQTINAERINELSLTQFIHQKADIWYHLIAFCAFFSKLPIEKVVAVTTLFTKTFFLLAIYQFSSYIFKEEKHKTLIAILSVIFVFFHMGINVMAYVRYYAFAPTMLAFIIYLASIIFFFELLSSKNLKQSSLLSLSILIFILSSATIHTQEAMFIIIMIFSISCVVSIKLFFNKALLKDSHLMTPKLINLITLLGIISFTLISLLTSQSLNQSPNIGWRLWEFSLFDLQFYTLNMRYQFMQVMTFWGLFVYILCIINFKKIYTNTFLFTGLLIPLITVLNPYFVDFYLRVADSTTLWRLCYIVPIHFAGAYILIKAFEKFKESISVKNSLALFLVTGILFLTLLPIKNTLYGIHYSRFPTLKSTKLELSSNYFSDLTSALNQINGRKKILTDPITGYVVRALTNHHSRQIKFFNLKRINYLYDDYTSSPLKQHKGKLIIINQRESSESLVGKLSKHWSKNIMDLSSYYNVHLLEHLKNNNDQFKLIWQSENSDIKVYRIL